MVDLNTKSNLEGGCLVKGCTKCVIEKRNPAEQIYDRH